MSQNTLVTVLIANFCCVFLLALAMQLNLNGLYVFLESKNYHQTEIEHIELLKMLGQMIFGMLMVEIITLINLRKLALVFLITLLINKFNIIFLDDYNLVKIHYLIAAGCNFSLMIICFMQLIESSPNNQNIITIIFVLLIVIGRILGEFAYAYIVNLGPLNFELFNSLIYVFILTIVVLTPIQPKNNGLFKIDFINLIKYIEFELLSAFVLFYTAMAIYWEYEVFAIAEDLKIDNIYQVINYTLVSVVLITCPLQFIIKNLNRQIINLTSLFVLSLSILSLKYFGNSYNFNLLAIIAIGICLSLVFINNLSTLTEKFEGENLKTAMGCYFGFSGMGGYLGMIVTEEAMNKIEEWGFIYSICFVVSSLLLYYLALNKKAK